jgi:hypothetical protein
MYFTKDDEIELQKRGLMISDLMQQIHQFTKETKPVKLEKPCTPGDGLLVLNGAECHRLQRLFESEKSKFTQIKFVPASGAASRMFKHLYNYNADNASDLTEEFIVNFDRFPFIPTLKKCLNDQGLSLDDMVANNEWEKIFGYILNKEGLHYDDQLKGMVIFHRYTNELRTAFDEHLFESLSYAKQGDGRSRIHFTVAPQHKQTVADYLSEKIKTFTYEHIEVDYSVQSPSTDTLALGKDDEPVRDENGKLFFRPSGHGALIQNLEKLDADIVFIKNIDNVTTTAQQEETTYYKQVLGGILIELKTEINKHLNALETDDEEALELALEFIQIWFQPGLPLGMNAEQLRQYATLRLDRPLRVCGMVRNEGEPGGGPFWVKMHGGYLSKQIVEKSQVDPHDTQQAKILASATHFNPVDIICSFKDRKGNNYKLDQFVDYTTGFVSEKFHHGHVIKALEWPGLWNGAMALWNTVFIEVPISTFNPVKTVNDLLRPGHV